MYIPLVPTVSYTYDRWHVLDAKTRISYYNVDTVPNAKQNVKI